jgi:(1->4)-alpha-D-glucan 1-alpha-D-glucosylmutase
VYDFVGDVLLRRASHIFENERDEHMQFVGKFQQLTSPVTARGIEDTALYIYNRLVSLNEVGSEPYRFGTPPAEAHGWFAERARRWRHSLSATSTHDTKRSEDVRARINVLSELPGAWKQAATRWARANRRARSIVDGESYPSRNEEFLLYQALLGSWPLHPMNDEEERVYVDRIVAYMNKAIREAKVYTSWLNPSAPHEEAMTRFVEGVLNPSNTEFREDFLAFQRLVAHLGLYNSLAQVTIKTCAPGVPDFYQGTELWDFSLVDPDNRRPVDYARRAALLAELDAALTDTGASALAARLMSAPDDDRLKLYATTTMLRFRRERSELFESGGYAALSADGARREHLFAFARVLRQEHVLVIVPRLVAALAPDGGAPIGERVWTDTRVLLPPSDGAEYRNVFTAQRVPVTRAGGRATVRVADVLESFPIAILEPA